MKVIGYARVSTNEQANTGVSLQAQEAKIRAYADLYNLKVIRIIKDKGASGKTLDRKGIQRALKLLQNGKAEGLLVAKLDRLTRSVVDMHDLITEYFGERSTYSSSLLSVNDQVDTRTASGRLVLNVLMSVAEWERETISERTREALAHKKAKGERLGTPRIGVKVKNGRELIDEKEMGIMRYIVELRQQGLSYNKIALRLQSEGYKTKRGKDWHSQTVLNTYNIAVKMGSE